MYHDREAELQARVDRRRVKVAFANASEPSVACAALRDLAAQIAALDPVSPEPAVTIDTVCEPIPADVDS